MKQLKIYFLLFALLPLLSNAQIVSDLINYSENFHITTARSASMGGAFHSLGGDLSVLSENPGGIGMFRTSQLTITPMFSQQDVESIFSIDNNKENTNSFNFGLSNFGFVIPLKNTGNADWVSINLGFSFNQRNSFKRDMLIFGDNNQSSMLDFFEGTVDGNDPEGLDNYGSRLFFDAYLLDTVQGSNFDYYLPLPMEGEPFLIRQKKSVEQKGGISEFDFAFGANFKNILYFGAAFGLKSVNFEETSFHEETNLELFPIEYDMDNFSFRQSYITRGKGFDFKLGAIIVPVEWLRFSVSYQTPTFYTLEDQFDSDLAASVSLYGDEIYESWFAEPTDADGYSLGESVYDYEVATPIKFAAGVSTILQKRLILSFGFESLDYSDITISAMDYDYTELKKEVTDVLGKVQNYKAGIEFRINSNFSIRGGYATYGDPYQDIETREQENRQFFSGGLGINSGSFFLDLAHVRQTSKGTHFLYDIYDDFKVVKGDFEVNESSTMLTMGFRF